MSIIAEALARINERLDLPQPQRSRILLEIADDMRSARDAWVDGGMDGDEAAERAVEKFDISNEALLELVDLHETAFRRMLAAVSMQARSWWERTAMVLVVLFVAALSGRQVLTAGVLKDAGPFIWGVALFSAASAVAAAWQVYRLYLKKEHDARRVRRGLPALALLGSGPVLTALLGSAVWTYRALASGGTDEAAVARGFMEAAIGSAALVMAGLVSAIAIFLVWFVLMNKAWKIERAELEILMCMDLGSRP